MSHRPSRPLRVVRAAAMLLAGITSAFAAEAAQPEAAAPAIDPSHFTVKIQSLTFNRTVMFNDGDLQHPTGFEQSMIQLIVGYDSAVSVLSVDQSVLTSATTDAGEDLAVSSAAQQPGMFGGRTPWMFNRQMGGAQRVAMAQAALTWPKKPGKTLTKIVGTCDVVCESKPAKPLELKPASAFVGKAQELPGGGSFTLLALAPVKYQMDNDSMASRVKGIELHDSENGLIQDVFPRSTSGDGKTYTVEMSGNLPEDGAMDVILIGEKQTVHVPFEVKNVPMTAPPPAPVVVAPAAPTAAPAPAAKEPAKRADF